jgi:hypothetical protein
MHLFNDVRINAQFLHSGLATHLHIVKPLYFALQTLQNENSQEIS